MKLKETQEKIKLIKEGKTPEQVNLQTDLSNLRARITALELSHQKLEAQAYKSHKLLTELIKKLNRSHINTSTLMREFQHEDTIRQRNINK